LAFIELRGVTKRHANGFEALRDINVAFQTGSMTFLTGHSGAGKSTFLRLLLRMEQATRGQIHVNGVNITQLPESRLPYYRRHVGAVFQDHHLLAGRSVFENVAIPLRVLGMAEKDLGRRVRAALTRVGLLEKERLLPQHLSTGEQQRVGIARAVANRPRILLADEPTGNLDPDLSRDIMALFEQFHQVGTTVIVATHDRELILESGKRIIELAGGRVVSDTGEDHTDPRISVDVIGPGGVDSDGEEDRRASERQGSV
jgi:cell division transport system ATP-binding protein